VSGLERREVLGGQHAGVVGAVGVPVRGCGERGRLLGDKSGPPLSTRRLHPRRPIVRHSRPATGRDEPVQRSRVGLVADQFTAGRRAATGQPRRRGRGPAGLEQLAHLRDRRGNTVVHRVPVTRVVDRRRQHVGELPGAVVAQQHQPGVDGAGDGGGQRTGTGHQGESLAAVVLDTCAGRSRTLPHEHRGPARFPCRREDAGHVTTGPVEVRLDDMQDEPRGHGGVESVAAAFQDRLRRPGREPVRRGRHPEGPPEGGTGGEGRRRREGVGHGPTLTRRISDGGVHIAARMWFTAAHVPAGAARAVDDDGGPLSEETPSRADADQPDDSPATGEQLISVKKWRVIGPGLVVAGTGVGAADLGATLTARPNHGYALLWAVVLGVLMKILLVEGAGRFSLASGLTIFQGWRSLGRWTTWYFGPYIVIWGIVYGASAMTSAALPVVELIPIDGLDEA